MYVALLLRSVHEHTELVSVDNGDVDRLGKWNIPSVRILTITTLDTFTSIFSSEELRLIQTLESAWRKFKITCAFWPLVFPVLSRLTA